MPNHSQVLLDAQWQFPNFRKRKDISPSRVLKHPAGRANRAMKPQLEETLIWTGLEGKENSRFHSPPPPFHTPMHIHTSERRKLWRKTPVNIFIRYSKMKISALPPKLKDPQEPQGTREPCLQEKWRTCLRGGQHPQDSPPIWKQKDMHWTSIFTQAL